MSCQVMSSQVWDLFDDGDLADGEACACLGRLDRLLERTPLLTHLQKEVEWEGVGSPP
jgi:hypothetical protein